MGRKRLVGQGILVSLANPYWSLWWATIGLAYVLQSRRWGIAGVIVFFLGHIAADLLWYSTVSFSVGKGRAVFTTKIYRAVVCGSAGCLVILAGVFLYGGIRKIFY